MAAVLYRDPDLGNILLPRHLARAVSLPGRVTRPASLGETCVVVAKQHRPKRRSDGSIEKMELIWHSISANERVDQGAVRQDLALFGSTSMAFKAIGLMSAAVTKTKTDLSLGSATGGVTTNEYASIGLARVLGTLGTYTAPGALGGQFTRNISNTFTASGTGVVYGLGLFDSVTVAGSNLLLEDLFPTSASLISGDTLTPTASFSN